MIGEHMPMEHDPAAAAGNTKNGFERAAEPVSEDYRTLPIEKGFNWTEIVGEAVEQNGPVDEKLYLVVFRSVRLPEADAALIAELDAAAHEEAMQSNALFHYFAGDVDDERRAMSWCLWTDQQSAREALMGSAHEVAARHANEFYGQGGFSIELYNVHHRPEFDDERQVFLDRL